MGLLRPVLIFLFICFLTSVSAQTGVTDYDTFIQAGEMSIGISTNAPRGTNPLTYEYQEQINVTFDVFSVEDPTAVATRVQLQLRASVLGDQAELKINLHTYQFSSLFDAQLTRITLGNRGFGDLETNMTDKIVQYQYGTGSNINFHLEGNFRGLQNRQLAVPADITFSSFSPLIYETGSLDFDQWEQDILPLSTLDVVVLPLVAVGAALHLLNQTSSSVSQKASAEVEQMKEQLDAVSSQASTVLDEHQDLVQAGRATKEAVEFVGDTREVYQEVGREYDDNWLTLWGKLTLGVYFILLLLSIITHYLELETVTPIIMSSYTTYTAAYLLVLFLYFVISFFRPRVLERIGAVVPAIHVFFILVSILTFVLFPLVYLYGELTEEGFTMARDLTLLSMISLGFIITALFAGYYLARSGTSWARILNSALTWLHLPRAVRTFFTRLLTILFFGIVLIRLSKTTALILTVLVSNQLSENAYLVSLAASYLKEEMAGPLWLVYGLILIFFIQAVMAIFLHLRKEQVVEEQENTPAFKAYRRLGLLLLVSSISFLHLILLLEGRIEKLGIDTSIYPQETSSSLDVWNVIFKVPPFRILLDILLALGLLLSLPFAMIKMWQQASEETKNIEVENK